MLQVLALSLIIWAPASVDAAGQNPPAAPAPAVVAQTGKVRLQLRIFEGADDITREARLQLFPRGQRTSEVATTLSAAQAYEADVEPGFYDV